MEKNTHLVNIYLKIHRRQVLTMDDLRYLAEYAPECFEKTCKNVVYKIPESKPIMEPEEPKPSRGESKPGKPSGRENIEKILENLKHLEIEEFPIANVDADKVKTLLGDLYMELLFPHNEKDTFMGVSDNRYVSTFDKKA